MAAPMQKQNEKEKLEQRSNVLDDSRTSRERPDSPGAYKWYHAPTANVKCSISVCKRDGEVY